MPGRGRTSWLEVEKRVWGREDLSALDELGTPTVESIREARRACPESFIIGSGGVRTRVDAVKALALGADVAGVALPLLAPAVESAEAVVRWLERFRREMTVTAFCAGCSGVKAIESLELGDVDFAR